MEEFEGDAALGHSLEDGNIVRQNIGFQDRRKLLVLNDIKNHARLVGHGMEEGVGESVKGFLDEAGDFTSVLKPHPEGHNLGRLARVTAQMQCETCEKLAVNVME